MNFRLQSIDIAYINKSKIESEAQIIATVLVLLIFLKPAEINLKWKTNKKLVTS